tara:strand:+ start:102826 stop:102981 length:156 start_codon:yes stop_codon:yes gene_type:complete
MSSDSGTDKDFEETVKRLLKMPAQTRGKDKMEEKDERRSSGTKPHGQVGKE